MKADDSFFYQHGSVSSVPSSSSRLSNVSSAEEEGGGIRRSRARRNNGKRGKWNKSPANREINMLTAHQFPTFSVYFFSSFFFRGNSTPFPFPCYEQGLSSFSPP